jgi:hypothetical protein
MKPSEIHNQFLATGKSEMCRGMHCHQVPSYIDNKAVVPCSQCLIDCSPDEPDGLVNFLHDIEDIMYGESDNP